MRLRGLLLLTIAAALLVSACGRKRRPARVPAPVKSGYTETGIASWYGRPYHGRRAASGEIYDMEKFTAAHRTLPFGTMIRVRNLGNGRTVEVNINDRGPFVRGRIIDLSRAAARAIEMLGPGTAKVRLEIAALPRQIPAGDYFAVQTGAFREKGNADRQRSAMERRYKEARLLRRDGTPPLWRVLVGREQSQEAAEALAERLRAQGDDVFVVRVDAAAGN